MWRDIFITIAQLIVASPRAWKDVEKEKRTQHEFLYRFLHPIFGIIAFTSFVGGLWFVREGNVENALKGAIISVVGVYGGYFIAAYLLNEIAPRFGLSKEPAPLSAIHRLCFSSALCLVYRYTFSIRTLYSLVIGALHHLCGECWIHLFYESAKSKSH